VQLALAQRRETAEQVLGDDAIEDAVAQEFQPLVVLRAAAAMGQRLLEQRGIGKAVAELPFQGRGPGQGVRYWPFELPMKSTNRPTLPPTGTSLR
jgi:hypothetical protein